MGILDSLFGGSKRSLENQKITEYNNAVDQMGENLSPHVKWLNIIKMRSNGQAQMAKQGIAKMDDYNYWAKGHLEEYMLKYENNEETGFYPDGVELRIKVFSEIIQEFEKVINKAYKLRITVNSEIYNDYCAARASIRGIQWAKRDIEELIRGPLTESEEKQELKRFKQKIKKGYIKTSKSIIIDNYSFSVNEAAYKELLRSPDCDLIINVDPQVPWSYRVNHPKGQYVIPNKIAIEFINSIIEREEELYGPIEATTSFSMGGGTWRQTKQYRKVTIPTTLENYFKYRFFISF